MKSNFNDLTGQKFSTFTVLYLSRTENKKTYWVVGCDCGAISEKMTCTLRAAVRKGTRTCRCYKKDVKKLNRSQAEIDQEIWTMQDWSKPQPKRKCKICNKTCSPTSYFYCYTHSKYNQTKSGDVFDWGYEYHG